MTAIHLAAAQLLAVSLLLLFLFSDASANFRRYEGYQLLRATPSTLAQLSALRNFTQLIDHSPSSSSDLEVWNFRAQLGESTELFAGPKAVRGVLDFLDNNQIGRELLVEDFGEQLKESMAQVALREPEQISSPDQFDLGHYHPYDAIVNYLRLLASSHPDFIQLHSIGRTSQGRDLAFLTLGYPSAHKKPAMFVDAGIHAREWIAPAVALHFINALIHNSSFHSLLSDMDIHILPVLNPDGYVHTWNKDRLWRRTRSGPKKADQKMCGPYDLEEGELCYGVDPNRNFPYHWGEVGISKCPCSQVYSGEKPLSEPECANLARFLAANRDSISAYLTLHAFSNLIIHPFGWQGHKYPENVEELRRVAKAMAKAIEEAGGDRFKVGSAPDILYSVSGSSDDYAYSQGIKYTFTMELTSGWYGSKYVGFVYPEKGINEEAAQVLPAIRILAEQVRKERGNGRENDG